MVESEARCVDGVLCEYVNHETRLFICCVNIGCGRGCCTSIGTRAVSPGSSHLSPVLRPMIESRVFKQIIDLEFESAVSRTCESSNRAATCPGPRSREIQREGKHTTSRRVLPQDVMARISSALSVPCSCSSKHSALPKIPCYKFNVSHSVVMNLGQERMSWTTPQRDNKPSDRVTERETYYKICQQVSQAHVSFAGVVPKGLLNS